MPGRLPMRHLREVLRLRYERKLSQREIARSLSLGLGTVSEFLGRAERAGLCWPVPEGWDDQALSERFYPAPASGRPRPLPEMAYIHGELRRPGVTLQRLWVEYLEAHPGGSGSDGPLRVGDARGRAGRTQPRGAPDRRRAERKGGSPDASRCENGGKNGSRLGCLEEFCKFLIRLVGPGGLEPPT
jgi:Sigma-70, region 4